MCKIKKLIVFTYGDQIRTLKTRDNAAHIFSIPFTLGISILYSVQEYVSTLSLLGSYLVGRPFENSPVQSQQSVLPSLVYPNSLFTPSLSMILGQAWYVILAHSPSKDSTTIATNSAQPTPHTHTAAAIFTGVGRDAVTSHERGWALSI